MSLAIHRIPYHLPWLPELARYLLADGAQGLHRDLVLLPAARAVDSLRHALLEVSNDDAVLLPDILTPDQLLAVIADRLDLAPPPVPDRLRAPLLAGALRDADWLHRRPETVEGMAEELLAILDELREHELDPAAPSGADEPLATRDLELLADAWRRYRGVVPRDGLDRRREAVDRLAADPVAPAVPPWQRVVVAGFVHLTPLWARLVRLVAERCPDGLLLVEGTVDDRDTLGRLLLALHADAAAPHHPLSPTRRVRELLGGEAEPPAPDPRPLRERLAAAGADALPPDLCQPCSDPEAESLHVARLVVEKLREEPTATITVATADRALARRIAAQLRDAGLDLDDTGGIPLSAHADGRLAWALLRCVVAGWTPRHLLELLTHPHVTLGRERGVHLARVRRFEQELLRGEVTAATPEGFRRRALEKDRLARLDGERSHTALVDDLAAALAPLATLRDRGRAPLADHVAALREAWERAAPRRPLSGDDDAPSLSALDGLLADLAATSGRFPALTGDEFASLLARLLRQQRIRQHRRRRLPVLVTGLLETRLERCDLLVLAGMNEDVFPGRLPRPLLPGPGWRREHGLPDWRHRLGMQAELLLRLLHGGQRVIVTWSREREGRPALPSPLVSRLLLTREEPPPTVPAAPLYRRAAPPLETIAVAQRAFASEPADVPLHVPGLLPSTLSHTAVNEYLGCPYRFLLGRLLRLREPERIIEQLEARDVGRIVHEALRAFLAPGGEGRAALAAGDGAAARAHLHRCLDEGFAAVAALPERALWLQFYGSLVPRIVEEELVRIRTWQPALLEVGFSFPLSALVPLLPDTAPPLPETAADIVMRGTIDRIDLDADGNVAILDYKTGKPPARKQVLAGKDLQLAIYALAVHLGEVEGLSGTPAVREAGYYRLSPDGVGQGKPVLVDPLDIGVLATRVTEVVAAIGADDAVFPLAPRARPDREPDVCRWCPYRGICRRQERELDEPLLAPEAAP